MKTKDLIGEIKRNMLGGLEFALFMPVGRTRFGESREEAIRSFVVPALLFPLTLIAVYYSPRMAAGENSANMISLLYSLRMLAVWVAFFGTVYWIARETERKKYFYKFVIASNWLTVPATIVFIPVLVMLAGGAHSWDELYPFMVCLMLYTYAFTAFMAAYVLRVPWELAGFITFIAMCVNDSTLKVLHWISDYL